MTGISDEFQEAVLEAQAEVMEVIQEFTGELQAEEIMREMGKVWATMPDELKEQFKQERPQQYEAFIKHIQGGLNGTTQ